MNTTNELTLECEAEVLPPPALTGRVTRRSGGRQTAKQRTHDDSKLIFLVDTLASRATKAKEILEFVGFSVCWFSDREVAWHALTFADPQPALLIATDDDAEVPGLAFLKCCKEIKPGVTTVLWTEFDPASFNNSVFAFVDGMLARPCSVSRFVQEVMRFCQLVIQPGSPS